MNNLPSVNITADHDRGEGEGSLTLDSFNLGKIQTKTQTTCCGKVRAFSTFSWFEWTYLSVSIVSLLISFALTAQRLISGNLDSSDFTFGILLILTIVFCGYYVIHAILTERADELLVFVASNAIVLIYCTFNFIKTYNSKTDVVKLARLIIAWILSPILIGSGAWLSVFYCRSNNLLFNTVGSIAELQKICKLFYLCCSLLKFDFQLQLSMVILVMGSDGALLDLEQKIILGSGVGLSIIFVIVGYYGLSEESKPLMIVFYVLGLLEPAYIAYKFYYTNKFESDNKNAVYESTFACGVFAFVVWMCLMVTTAIFMTNYFDKGLKQRMRDYPNTQTSVTTSGRATD